MTLELTQGGQQVAWGVLCLPLLLDGCPGRARMEAGRSTQSPKPREPNALGKSSRTIFSL